MNSLLSDYSWGILLGRNDLSRFVNVANSDDGFSQCIDQRRRVRLGFEFILGVFTDGYKTVTRDVLLMRRQAKPLGEEAWAEKIAAQCALGSPLVSIGCEPLLSDHCSASSEVDSPPRTCCGRMGAPQSDFWMGGLRAPRCDRNAVAVPWHCQR